jgi:hypothetical protein
MGSIHIPFVCIGLVLLVATVVHSQNLDPRPSDTGRKVVYFFGGAFKVSYIIDGTTIDIAMAVRTLGWIAFGIRR